MEGPAPKKCKSVESEKELCSFGVLLNEECHKYSSDTNYVNFLDLSGSEKEILQWRAGLSDRNIETLCDSHYQKYGERFFQKQKSASVCDNIFDKHKKKGKKAKGDRVIDLELAKKLKSKGKDCVPGKRLCKSCFSEAKSLTKETSEPDSSSSDSIASIENVVERSIEKEKVDEGLSLVGISPLKTGGLPTHAKISKTRSKLAMAFEAQTELAASALNVDKEKLQTTDIASKAADYDRLLYLIKEKLSDKSMKVPEKIQILTLAPKSWSIPNVMQFFDVTEYQVRESRKILESKGILSKPDAKRGSSLSDEIIKDVQLFYEDDEYSRMMPGKKDCVSIGRNIHRQKRLLLCNLNELYTAFKAKHPNHKIGLSKFCALRPKWCVTVASSGSHTVCVCTIHQNTTLAVDAYQCMINSYISSKNRQERHEKESLGDNFEPTPKFEIDYKTLLKQVVCDTDNMECMVHRCEKCPGYKSLELYLQRKLEELEIDMNDDVSYTQWDSTDRTTLRTVTSSVTEFLELLVYQVDNLAAHSFTAKSQARYLKERKEKIDESSCVVLLDFAENYHFIVQDEVQGYHWNKEQCTVHPVVIYYKDGGNNLKHKSLCFLSDDLDHDTSVVHEL